MAEPAARELLALGIQEWHDEWCLDVACKCHEKDCGADVVVSPVAVAKANELIAEIEYDAVREYRFG